MTVFANVAFPLTVGGGKPPKDEIEEKTLCALELVGLREYASRSATALSGGQQQRVALARALVREPAVLLLDEPLSNLDAQLRERMREEIREVQQKLGITAVYVTHDQNEALAISDSIVLMERGEIVELGAPEQIYRSPRSPFTANFIGIANELTGTVRRDGAGAAIVTPLGVIAGVGDATLADGETVDVILRPEHFAMHETRRRDDSWSGTVAFRTYQGDCWEYHIVVSGTTLRVRAYNEKRGLSRGATVYLDPDPDSVVVMPARAAVS
jgi:iron(III) transport system ATP-binding protein